MYKRNRKHITKFMFTKDLIKVKTWKTLNCAKETISSMISNLEKNLSQILIPLTKEQESKFEESKLIFIRKKAYYPIKSITSQLQYNLSKEVINKLSPVLAEDSKKITDLIEGNKITDIEFMPIFRKFENDVHEYITGFNLVERHNNGEPLLDIVDASYGFRLIKLQTLAKIQESN